MGNNHIIPKLPQYAEFSVSQGLNIKASLCNNGGPFLKETTKRVSFCETPFGLV